MKLSSTYHLEANGHFENANYFLETYIYVRNLIDSAQYVLAKQISWTSELY